MRLLYLCKCTTLYHSYYIILWNGVYCSGVRVIREESRIICSRNRERERERESRLMIGRIPTLALLLLLAGRNKEVLAY